MNRWSHSTLTPRGDPTPSGDGTYSIDLKRIQTFRDLAGWTAHLMGHRWLQHTDWDELISNALGGASGRLVSKHKEPWLV